MRFKAKLAPEQLSMLYQVILPLSRIASSGGGSGSGGGGGGGGNDGGNNTSSIWTRSGSILYLDDTYFRISTKGKSNDTDNIRCFAEFSHDIFLEHRIESAADLNAIVMEVDLAQLKLALQSLCQDHHRNGYYNRHHNHHHHQQHDFATDSQLTLIKLAKRDGIPCLCLNGGAAEGEVQVHHSIPVRIRRASEMPHYLPPKINSPDVQLELISETSNTNNHPILRSLVDGLKSLSPTVNLEATTNGDLTISMDSDGASIRTYYNNLPAIQNENTTPSQQSSSHQQQQQQSSKSSCTIKVDTKKLCSSLHWQQQPLLSSISSALLCFVENEMLVVHAVLRPQSVGFFTYYIPVHYISNDMTEE